MSSKSLKGGYFVPAVVFLILLLSGLYIHVENTEKAALEDQNSQNVGVSTPVPDTSAPMVAILSHSDWATVSGTARITATTFDNVGVTKVEFYKNNVLYSSDNTVPYSVSWNTRLEVGGVHTWSARAYDNAGNVGVSRNVRLAINNSIPVTQTVATAPVTPPSQNTPATPLPPPPSNPTPTTPDYDEPSISFSVSSTNISYNSSTSFSWTTQDASSCIAYGDWSGSRSTSGSYSTGNLTSSKTYRLECTGPGGSKTRSLTITVAAQQNPNPPDPPAPPQDTTPPTVAITAPITGSSVSSFINIVAEALDNVGVTKVEFYRNGVLHHTSLTAPYLGPWNAAAGPYVTSSWTARAYDAAGNMTTSSSVSLTAVDPNIPVDPPVPTVVVTLSVDDNDIPYDESVTLTWSSSGATSCSSSGSWSGSRSLSGTYNTPNLTQNSSFTLSCTNGTNSDSKTVNVTVGPEPATETLAEAAVAEVAALISGKTPPSFSGSPPYPNSIVNIFGTNGRHNPNIWASGVNLTCIPRNGGTNGVLITPRDMIYAAHFGSSAPTFVDSGGTSHPRTTAATTAIPGTDILVSTLNADLPSGVKPCKLVPSNIRSYSPPPATSFAQADRYPMVFTNQDRTLLIGGVYGFNSLVRLGGAISSTFSGWSYPLRQFDSGSGVFLLINNQIALLTNWYTTTSGPIHADYISEINAAISAHGSPHSVSTINLSEFQTY